MPVHLNHTRRDPQILSSQPKPCPQPHFSGSTIVATNNPYPSRDLAPLKQKAQALQTDTLRVTSQTLTLPLGLTGLMVTTQDTSQPQNNQPHWTSADQALSADLASLTSKAPRVRYRQVPELLLATDTETKAGDNAPQLRALKWLVLGAYTALMQPGTDAPAADKQAFQKGFNLVATPNHPLEPENWQTTCPAINMTT